MSVVRCQMSIHTPIKDLRYIGPHYVKKLNKVGITTIKDLLFYFPHRYEDFSNITSISNVQPNKKITLQGEIKSIKNSKSPYKKMPLTKALLEDKTGSIEVIWFNQPYLKKTLKKGTMVNLSGKVVFDNQRLVCSNPGYEVLKKPGQDQKKQNFVHTGRLVPIYHETEGLSSRYLRFIIQKNLYHLKEIKDFLPPETKRRLNLLTLKKALRQIHFPKNKAQIQKARRRLAFNELFLIQLLLKQKKQNLKQKTAYSIGFKQDLIKSFVEKLPFQLTDAQRKAAWEIIKDLQKPTPMRRLLEGDVGSGKTVVATIAALGVVKEGFQVAFMAPTEVLAFQHFRELKKELKKFDVKISLLTGSRSEIFYPQKEKSQKTSKQDLLDKVSKGEIEFIIGTHALIQDKVEFKKLALTIVDEQHRFGINQRAKLLQPEKSGQPQGAAPTTADKQQTQKESQGPALNRAEGSGSGSMVKGQRSIIPHLLSMTATPIPRTLSLALYGDLDISILDEMPKGRKRIITKVVAPQERNQAYKFIRKQIKKGHQAYIICPLIEESEALDSKAVKKEYQKLSQNIFPDLKVDLLHGRLLPDEKRKVMKKFKEGEIDILVATSVIEVGVDIPQATVIVIEGAERFGLAQLHQIRGRVGRSKAQSYCFLFTRAPLSEDKSGAGFTTSPAKNTRKRLKALVNLNNGFKLAEKDLEIRGPGDFMGTRQSGIPDLTMASLDNIELIKDAASEAEHILSQSPNLEKFPVLKQKLESFGGNIHLE